LTDIRDKSEVGELMWSVNELIDRCDAFPRESAAFMNYVSRNQYFRRLVETGMLGAFLASSRRISRATDSIASKVREFRKIADNFEAMIKGVVQTVAAASTEMKATARTIGVTAERTSQRAIAVAAASEEASASVATVASAAEALTSSIRRIGVQLQRSSEITSNAARESDATSRTVQGLAGVAQDIHEAKTAAGETGIAAGQVLRNATGLSRQSEKLNTDVDRFLEAIRKVV
jgi:hypothetical protein